MSNDSFVEFIKKVNDSGIFKTSKLFSSVCYFYLTLERQYEQTPYFTVFKVNDGYSAMWRMPEDNLVKAAFKVALSTDDILNLVTPQIAESILFNLDLFNI